MNHKTVRTPGVWLQLLRSSSADGFSLLFCCKHCRLQHNTHTPEPAVCLYLQMSSNYNCERFAEGKSRVGRKKTEKRAERTGNEQRVQGEKKKKKEKHKKGRKGWKVASPGLLPRKPSTHTPRIYDCEKALQQPAVIIWWLFNLFYSRIPVTSLTPGQAKWPEGVCWGFNKKKKKKEKKSIRLIPH